MTGGTIVVLGQIGDNFGAGFTGGMAFVLDKNETFEARVNPETLLWGRVEAGSAWEETLHGLVQRHADETGSAYAKELLHRWDRVLPQFWQIVPRDYARIIGYELPHEVQALSA